MADWGAVRPIAAGGLLAVGFIDEHRVIVGSHNGVGIIDASSGALIERVPDVEGSYEWFSETPPSATWMDAKGVHTVPVAGLWGGRLPETTADGWPCNRSAEGATLIGPDGSTLEIADEEEFRAFGFSPGGRVFVYLTSPTLYLVAR
jgi:hypothetical protein